MQFSRQPEFSRKPARLGEACLTDTRGRFMMDFVKYPATDVVEPAISKRADLQLRQESFVVSAFGERRLIGAGGRQRQDPPRPQRCF